MSSDSVIEEDILEQIDSGDSEEDLDKEQLGDSYGINKGEREGVEQKVGHIAESLDKGEDVLSNSGNCEKKTVEQGDGAAVNETNETPNTDIETDLETKNNLSRVPVDKVDKVNIAIINYSGLLADNVLQEALLINEIYTRDSINNESAEDRDAVTRDKDIRKHLFPSENGRIASKENDTGCDSYLLDKLLRSKADPEEVPETEGFDGNEDHFKRSKDETYPGLDSDDAYVKAELDRTNSAREISDNNNNQMAPGLVEPFDDNILETIHEDSELVLDNGFHGNNDSLHDEVGADVEKISDPDYTAEDEMSNPDNPYPEVEISNVAFNKRIEIKQELERYAGDEESEQEVPIHEDDSEASEDEPDCCEMTFKQKQAVVKAVRKGDIATLEKLLEKKNADMGMIWYGENLLMVAIRSDRQEMAEFLIDNAIDWRFQRKLVEVDENGVISVHKITAREMAYDSNMEELVELLDYKMDNLFPFVKAKSRIFRLRQPIAPFEPPPLDEGFRNELMIEPEEAKQLQKEALKEYKQRQKEIELENLEMMQKRRKGQTPGNENESVQTVKSVHNFSELNVVHDDISQVFGPDEGYETMSPVSPHRHYFHEPDMREHVSLRTTRAFHLKKAFIASKSNNFNRSDSPDYPMYQNNLIESVGSYNFESRRWHVPKSAPQLRNYSIESLQDPGVHVGLPFVHDEKRKIVSANSGRNSVPRRRIQSAHDNISPYSQVAKLLEQSRLFSPISRSATPHFPAISNKDSANKNPNGRSTTKTKMNYIYADRSSAKPKRIDLSTSGTDLLPKRKIHCEL